MKKIGIISNIKLGEDIDEEYFYINEITIDVYDRTSNKSIALNFNNYISKKTANLSFGKIVIYDDFNNSIFTFENFDLTQLRKIRRIMSNYRSVFKELTIKYTNAKRLGIEDIILEANGLNYQILKIKKLMEIVEQQIVNIKSNILFNANLSKKSV